MKEKMGLFNKLLGNKENEKTEKTSGINWNNLESLDELQDAFELSKEKTIAIFKHSTRCGISRMVLNNFEKEFDLENGDVKMYFLDLIQFRGISNEIAARTSIWHESPQLLIIKNGEAVHHSSHSSISANTLKDFI